MYNDDDKLMDEYLDGLLDHTQREVFEKRSAQQVELREEVQQQRRIDDALKRNFAPGSVEERITEKVEALTASTRGSQEKKTGLDTSKRRRWAVAAILAIGAVSVWNFARNWPDKPERKSVYAPQAWRSLETVYRDEVERGFKPGWVCENEQVFASAFQNRFEQGLMLADAGEGITALGLAYGNSITTKTMHLLARVHNEPVIVFVDRADADKGQTLDPGGNLHLYHRTLGTLVLYELTPLESPQILNLFFDPDSPPKE